MSNRKLLLADDSVTIQKVVNLTFADEGVDVVTFGDGDSALASIRDIRPDIVLADVHMPGANGYQICEALRSADDTRNIPVILLVGSFEPFDEAEAGRVGANSFMTKPFQSIRQLVLQVNELLGPPAETPVAEMETEPSVEVEIPMIARSEKTDDIESLYEQSVTGSSRQPASEQAFELGDQGMDDEMIETSYTGGSDESDTLTYETGHPVYESEPASFAGEPADQHQSSYYQGPEPERIAETSHHTSWEPEVPPVVKQTAEWQPDQPPPVVREEAAWEPEQPPPVWNAEPEPALEYHAEPAGQSEQFNSYAEPARQPEPEQEYHAEYASPVAAESAHQPHTQPEAPNQSFDYGQQAATEEYPAGSADFAAGSDNIPNYMGQETVAFDRKELELPPSSSSFEEVELLDLPPAGTNQTIELTTAERAELMGRAKQVVSISPELMEIIVQKVVERLSQKY